MQGQYESHLHSKVCLLLGQIHPPIQVTSLSILPICFVFLDQLRMHWLHLVLCRSKPPWLQERVYQLYDPDYRLRFPWLHCAFNWLLLYIWLYGGEDNGALRLLTKKTRDKTVFSKSGDSLEYIRCVIVIIRYWYLAVLLEFYSVSSIIACNSNLYFHILFMIEEEL